MRRNAFLANTGRTALITMALFLTTVLLVGCPGFGDCIWSGKAQVWLDENENGLVDEDEPPLPGIVLHIDDVRNNFERVETSAVSDETGMADLNVWLPGCPLVDFVVYAEAPIEYELTTAERISVRRHGNETPFMFGYRYLPRAAPTPMPEPEQLSCRRYRIPYYSVVSWQRMLAFTPDGDAWTFANEHTRRVIRLRKELAQAEEFGRDKDFLGYVQVHGLAAGPDGTVWLATESGVSQFDPENDSWTSHIVDNGLHTPHAWQIAVLPQHDVLVITDAGLEVLDAPTISWRLLFDSSELDAMGLETLQQREHDVILVGKERILRFWRAEGNELVQWELLWSRDDSPPLPTEDIYAVAVAPDDTVWVSGYSHEQGNLVAYLTPGAAAWGIYSYRGSSGVFGTAAILQLAPAADLSVWMNEGDRIAHGVPMDGEPQRLRWFSYDNDSLVLYRFSSNFTFSQIAVAPDNALWVADQYRWWRCSAVSP